MYFHVNNYYGQWRELNSIFKRQDKHILINFVYDYPKEHLLCYTDKVIAEFDERGYKINKIENYRQYFKDITLEKYRKFLKAGREYTIFAKKMDNRYLRECLYNLEEKAICDGISKEEWQKIYEKYKDKFDLWDGKNDD